MADRAEHLTDATWEALAMRELPPAARDAAMDHIVGCRRCTEVYRSLRQLEDEARTFDPAVPAPAPPASPRLPAFYAIAAAVALVIGGAAAYRSWSGTAGRPSVTPAASTTQPHAALALIAVTPPTVRLSDKRALQTRGAADANAFVEAMAAGAEPYRRGRYDEAAPAFAAVATRFPDAYEPPFYAGVSLLLGGNASGAVASLQNAERLAETDARAEIRWYLAAALQRAGRDDDARVVLEGVCGASGEWQSRACTALKVSR